MSKIIHIGIGKLELLRAIRREGPSECLVNFAGTQEEALSVVRNSPREVYSDCPTPRPDGSCPGHLGKKSRSDHTGNPVEGPQN